MKFEQKKTKGQESFHFGVATFNFRYLILSYSNLLCRPIYSSKNQKLSQNKRVNIDWILVKN
jgi:hypothetical protein